MNGQEDTRPIGEVATLAGCHGVVSANRLAQAVRSRWQQGEPPNVAAVLTEHPDLHRYRSVVLDLACEEYQYRLAQGESLDAQAFAQQFPSLQKSLYLLLEVQRLLDDDLQFRTTREASPWPKPGEDFLGFQLLAELGRGTFGRVFLASEPALGHRLVALKVAPHGGEEAEIVGRLRHPNIVPIYSIQEDPATGLTAVCMPYLGRTTLCDVRDHAFADDRPPAHADAILQAIHELAEVDDTKETPAIDPVLARASYVDAVLHLGAQLADALAYTHARGICHRDLKPSNVLLTLEGRPLLLDFNLSFDAQQSVKRVGGTLPYMAPEQLRMLLPQEVAASDHADPRSDLFSLGVILYELLCGCLPFGPIPNSGTLEQVAVSLLERQKRGPEPIVPQNGRVDRSIEQLVYQCLAFDPADRPPSAEALAAALRRQLAPLPKAKRWARGHPVFSMGMAMLLVLFLLGGALGLALRDPASLRQFRQGEEFVRQEKYGLALDAFTEAVRLDPTYVPALLARARICQKLGQHEEALENVRAAYRRSPNGRLMAALGYCYMKVKNPQNAGDCFRKALDMGYRTPGLLNNLGFFCLTQGEYDQAEEYLDEALQLDGDLLVAHFNLLIVYFNGAAMDRPVPDKAFFHVRRCLDLAPTHPTVLFSCSSMLLTPRRIDPSHKMDESHRQLTLRCLRSAVAHGVHPRALQATLSLPQFQDDKELQAILTMPADEKPPHPPLDRIVNPLDDWVLHL